jgi:hypothetical protein
MPASRNNEPTIPSLAGRALGCTAERTSPTPLYRDFAAMWSKTPGFACDFRAKRELYKMGCGPGWIDFLDKPEASGGRHGAGTSARRQGMRAGRLAAARGGRRHESPPPARRSPSAATSTRGRGSTARRRRPPWQRGWAGRGRTWRRRTPRCAPLPRGRSTRVWGATIPRNRICRSGPLATSVASSTSLMAFLPSVALLCHTS